MRRESAAAAPPLPTAAAAGQPAARAAASRCRPPGSSSTSYCWSMPIYESLIQNSVTASSRRPAPFEAGSDSLTVLRVSSDTRLSASSSRVVASPAIRYHPSSLSLGKRGAYTRGRPPPRPPPPPAPLRCSLDTSTASSHISPSPPPPTTMSPVFEPSTVAMPPLLPLPPRLGSAMKTASRGKRSATASTSAAQCSPNAFSIAATAFLRCSPPAASASTSCGRHSMPTVASSAMSSLPACGSVSRLGSSIQRPCMMHCTRLITVSVVPSHPPSAHTSTIACSTRRLLSNTDFVSVT
mmetsp:Transcript_17274/g.51906  ORF Transcript_17274/g.51906 Transcript_17274/m.51906 type:complete len:296 (-) Transcript_17274:5053-5940(-)